MNGATPEHVALANVSGKTEPYSLYALGPDGRRAVGSGTVPAGATATVSLAQLLSVGLQPLVVESPGPLAISEDVGPSGNYGVVTMPGIPFGAAIGG